MLIFKMSHLVSPLPSLTAGKDVTHKHEKENDSRELSTWSSFSVSLQRKQDSSPLQNETYNGIHNPVTWSHGALPEPLWAQLHTESDQGAVPDFQEVFFGNIPVCQEWNMA